MIYDTGDGNRHLAAGTRWQFMIYFYAFAGTQRQYFYGALSNGKRAMVCN
jgi:hypothetical protein